jgi:hypothetical protein
MSIKPEILTLPILTLPDPVTTGEGILDPLGLSSIGDRLADWILPALAVRMSKPRFLTAMAVSAAICDGLQEELASDGVTPAHIVFEWLLLEGFVRQATDKEIRGTPGSDKARTARDNGVRLSAKTYLKTPSVFGFHGVYKRLARHTGIVDEDFCLADNGQLLLRIWEKEQSLTGIADTFNPAHSATGVKQLLRSAIEDGLKAGYSSRSGNWQGWAFFARHLTPNNIGREEASFLRHLMSDIKGDN